MSQSSVASLASSSLPLADSEERAASGSTRRGALSSSSQSALAVRRLALGFASHEGSKLHPVSAMQLPSPQLALVQYKKSDVLAVATWDERSQVRCRQRATSLCATIALFAALPLLAFRLRLSSHVSRSFVACPVVSVSVLVLCP